MRVHELAKELGVTSKDLLAEMKSLGHTVKNHMSQVEDEVREQLLAKHAGTPKPVAKDEVKPRKEAAVPAKQPRSAKVEKVEIAEEKKPIPPAKKDPEPQAASAALSVRFPITVGHLADQLNVRVPELIKTLMGIGIFASVNQLINEEIGFKVAAKLGLTIEKAADEEEQIAQQIEKEDPKKLKPRAPVVTFMGHVDHGKTSLLDTIRKTNVAAKEKGFITQHIGAYGVDIPNKGHVTFLDTPGHEAFTAMRARGANVTDVVVLVVAADDGVMPQTVEAVDHAREAGCPIVVAINKSDLPSANPQKVMTGLQKMGLMPEEWGGKTICVKVSAKTGQGIDNLLEMLLLEAEVLELKANADCSASGTVIEGHLSKGSGPVVTVIIQRGTLRVGDTVVCGPFYGRVKALKNDLGKTVKEALPSYAVELSGLNGVAEAGESFRVVENEAVARKITDQRNLELREIQMRGARKHLALEDLYQKISEGNFKELKLIIKADTQGSVEAISQSLEKLSTDKCQLRVIHGGVGGINESDVVLAAASDAVIIGFHVKADSKAEEIGEKEGVDIRFYHIIYEAVEDVRKAMEGLLEPTLEEVVQGKIQIRKIFRSSKAGTVGGAMVIKGRATRQHHVRLIRNHVVIFDGKFSSLRRFKDDVREVAEGYECGVTLQGFDDLREGDTLECYKIEKTASKL